MRKPYVIQARVKNNLILSRILERAQNVRQFCLSHGFNISAVGHLLNMQRPALNQKGDWIPLALSLADALDCLPDDLFTEEQRIAKARSNQAFIELTRQQALAMTDTILSLENADLAQRLLTRSGLSPREEQIIRLQFDKDMSLEEIGNKFHCTRSNIDIISKRALSKMAHYAKRMKLTNGLA